MELEKEQTSYKRLSDLRQFGLELWRLGLDLWRFGLVMWRLGLDLWRLGFDWVKQTATQDLVLRLKAIHREDISKIKTLLK